MPRLSKDLLRDRRHWWWLAALLFVVLNGALLSMYRVVYAVRYDQLGGQAQARQEALEGLERERRELEALLEQAQANRAGIETLYRERFATERERLTKIISEVKELAHRAGLEPGSIAYPEEVIAEHDLVKKSIAFSVEGSYLSLRRFINFLELSSSFLVLEGISVTSAEPRLRINLTISTLFADAGRGSSAPATARRGRA